MKIWRTQKDGMRLRKLEIKDAPLMLEWMHDELVVKDLKTDFKRKTIQDCEEFIRESQRHTDNLHLAIVDDYDEYMGTVSLKHIQDKTAEFAITVRQCAMGKGYSQYAMAEIILKGFNELGLVSIYWCVNMDNQRAIRFYDKNGYSRIDSNLLKIRGGTVQSKFRALSGTAKQGKEERLSANLCRILTAEYKDLFLLFQKLSAQSGMMI